jgi:hypothetical protein
MIQLAVRHGLLAAEEFPYRAVDWLRSLRQCAPSSCWVDAYYFRGVPPDNDYSHSRFATAMTMARCLRQRRRSGSVRM